ncbi:AI-2E family transporter [Demequina pelophila]|uniref:AI-2E family transporter n=1 Tax=Demequina pelophila TaxID=1638984 RepID=UPI000782133A|nr:AI-2E family transporter [Demequina pelophila]
MAEPRTTELPGAAEPAPDFETEHVPLWLRVTAAWSWRLIVVGIVVWVFATGFTQLATVVLPLGIALLIAAPLERLVARMEGWGIHRTLGSALSLVGLVVVILGLSFAAGSSIVAGFDDLRDAAVSGFNQFLDWLVDGPIHMSREQIDEVIANGTSALQDNAWGLATGAFSVTGTIGTLFAGSAIALFALFFFLRDGRTLWLWFVGLMPKSRKETIDRAGSNAWVTLRRYTQTSVFVAFIDAVGIGLAAWIIGVPLVIPIAIFVFLLSFIPLIGATLSGAIAVAVALFDGGWVSALLMMGAVLLVQQLEGNILYPWLFGKAVSLHPLAILLTVATGTLLLGLVGAVIAVPILSFGYAFARSLHSDWRADKDDDAGALGEGPKVALQRARDVIAKTGEIRIRRRPHPEDSSHED